jgi:GH18 family chitinase
MLQLILLLAVLEPTTSTSQQPRSSSSIISSTSSTASQPPFCPALDRLGGSCIARCQRTDDCTAELQQALETAGASLVQVPPLPGGRPWIVGDGNWTWHNRGTCAHGVCDPGIGLGPESSHRTLLFQPGVAVLAKKGSMHQGELFHITNVTNLTLTGYGAVFQMRKRDYQNPLLYNRSEDRHALTLDGCTKVSILGLTIKSSGGDGIYMTGVGELAGNPAGYNRDVLIQDVVSDDNHRQGMSVISVVGLKVINCTFSNTNGTAPQAGIDFEPNVGADRLEDIVLDNVRFFNNSGMGIQIAANGLGHDGRPGAMTSFVFRNILIDGGGRGGFWWDDVFTSGTVLLEHAVIRNLPYAGLMLELTEVDRHHLTLRDVLLENVATNYSHQAAHPSNLTNYTLLPTWRAATSSPIVLGDPKYGTNTVDTVGVGGIYFASNVTVTDSRDRPWARFVGAPSGGVGDLVGEVSVHNPHGCSHYLPVAKGRSPPQEAVLDLTVNCMTARNLKSDDADGSLPAVTAAPPPYPKCSCANMAQCSPLQHGPPAADVHVYSDCGGPWASRTTPGNTTCDWHAFDFNTTTTIVRMVGHPIRIGVDGAVDLDRDDRITWPESELLCHAHANDVRMLIPILRGSDTTKHYFQNLLGNATAVKRMASELLAIVTAAGWDGIEFDFEGMWSEITPGNTFDFAGHHVAMIKTTADMFHASLPHSTVAITMGAADLTAPSEAIVLKAYPIPGLAEVADQIFVMAYDMWHGDVVCAGPNAPLPAAVASLKSFIKLGAPNEKLIFSIPWYGYEYRCNSTYTSADAAGMPRNECVGVGQPPCLVGSWKTKTLEHAHYGLGTWAMEEAIANKSSGCRKEWSDEFSSPYINCPSSYEPLPDGKKQFPWVGPPTTYTTQSWYDDARSTLLKVKAAKKLGLGGVGVFTGEGVAKDGAGEYWDALASFK